MFGIIQTEQTKPKMDGHVSKQGHKHKLCHQADFIAAVIPVHIRPRDQMNVFLMTASAPRTAKATMAGSQSGSARENIRVTVFPIVLVCPNEGRARQNASKGLLSLKDMQGFLTDSRRDNDHFCVVQHLQFH